MASPSPPEMHPLLRERLGKQRTVFAPGNRIRMNMLPMLLNVLLPWGAFTVCCGMTSFRYMYSAAGLVEAVLAFFVVIWLFTAATAYLARKGNAEPTWWTYVALTLGVAVFAGTCCGLLNFTILTKPYFNILDLKVVHQLDAGRELGQNLMDAGILYFAEGNHLDAMKSWHFKNGALYCVAPVTDGAQPQTRSYDFWAVGKDCCATSTSDFRCGRDWGSASSRAGIRVLDEGDVTNYRLAVQQAETLYGILAAHPVFVTWEHDPVHEVNSWYEKAFRNYAFMVAVAFVLSLLTMVLTICRFAWIGRARSAYSMEFEDDAARSSQGARRPTYAAAAAGDSRA